MSRLLKKKNKNKKKYSIGKTCLCYGITLRFDFLQWFKVRTALILDKQNPEISGFSTAHAYRYKTKRQTKMKRRQKENLSLYLKSTKG